MNDPDAKRTQRVFFFLIHETILALLFFFSSSVVYAFFAVDLPAKTSYCIFVYSPSLCSQFRFSFVCNPKAAALKYIFFATLLCCYLVFITKYRCTFDRHRFIRQISQIQNNCLNSTVDIMLCACDSSLFISLFLFPFLSLCLCCVFVFFFG